MAQFEAIYGDESRAKTAVFKLDKLIQNEDALQYTAEFCKIAADTKFNEEAKRHYYLQGLKINIRTAIATMPDPPDTLAKLISVSIKINNNFKELRGTKQQIFMKQRSAGTPSPSNTTHPQLAKDPNAMEIDAQGRRKISEKTKAYRRSKGLCLRCSLSGHFAKNCNTRSPPKGSHIRAVNTEDIPAEEGASKEEMGKEQV